MLKRGSVPLKSFWGECAAQTSLEGNLSPFAVTTEGENNLCFTLSHARPGAGTKTSRKVVESGLKWLRGAEHGSGNHSCSSPPALRLCQPPFHSSISFQASLSAETEIFMVFPEEIARVHTAPPGSLAAKENKAGGRTQPLPTADACVGAAFSSSRQQLAAQKAIKPLGGTWAPCSPPSSAAFGLRRCSEGVQGWTWGWESSQRSLPL